MKIHLMRHFKVENQFNFWHTSKEFDFLRQQYDINPIVNQAVDKIEVEKIYISSLVRTKLTALSVGYLEEDLKITPLLNEVPNRSFMDSAIPLPTFLWKAMGRLQWLLEIGRQPETKSGTLERIRKMMEKVEMGNVDALLIGHGFYFSQLENELRKRGYAGKRVRFFKNGEVASYEKLDS